MFLPWSHSVFRQNPTSGTFLEMTDLFSMSGGEDLCVCPLCIQSECMCVGEFWLDGSFWQSSILLSLVANIRQPARHVMETLGDLEEHLAKYTPWCTALDGYYCAGYHDNLLDFMRPRKNAGAAPGAVKRERIYSLSLHCNFVWQFTRVLIVAGGLTEYSFSSSLERTLIICTCAIKSSFLSKGKGWVVIVNGEQVLKVEPPHFQWCW